MKYKEMLYKDYSEVLYPSFISTLVLHKQNPFKAIEFSNKPNIVTIQVYKRGPNGYVTTKKLVANKKQCNKIKGWLNDDFPNLEIISIDND